MHLPQAQLPQGKSKENAPEMQNKKGYYLITCSYHEVYHLFLPFTYLKLVYLIIYFIS